MKKINFFIIGLLIACAKISGMENKIDSIQEEMDCSSSDESVSLSSEDSETEDALPIMLEKIQKLLTKKAFEAISDCNWKKLEECFESIVDADADDKNGQTLLASAILKKDKDIVQTLLLHGVDVNVLSGRFQLPPLNIAIRNDEEITKMLLAEVEIDLTLSSNDGSTALHEAIMFSRNGLIEQLISKGADVNAQNQAGQTPLNIALDELHPNHEAAEILKKYGAFENITFEPILMSQVVQPPVCEKIEFGQ